MKATPLQSVQAVVRPVPCDCPTCVALNKARDTLAAEHVAWQGQQLKKIEALELVSALELLPDNIVLMKKDGKWQIMCDFGKIEKPTLREAMQSFIRLHNRGTPS